MHAQLVHAASHQAAADQRQASGIIPGLVYWRHRQAFIAGDGRLPSPIGDGDAAAIPRVAIEGQRDGAACRCRHAVHDGEIVLVDALRPHVALQRRHHLGALGDQQHPRGHLVEARQQGRRVTRGPLGRPMQQAVQQRAGVVLVGRMHDEARGLIDGQQVCVFVNHINRHRLAAGHLAASDVMHVDAQAVAGGDAPGDTWHGPAIDGDAA